MEEHRVSELCEQGFLRSVSRSGGGRTGEQASAEEGEQVRLQRRSRGFCGMRAGVSEELEQELRRSTNVSKERSIGGGQSGSHAGA